MADQASTRPPVLIVGGAGYFGARLAEELSIDHSVTITQRSRSAERDAWVSRRGLRSVAFDSARSDTIIVDGQFDAIVNLAMSSAAQAAGDLAAVRGDALEAVDACMRLLDEGRARRLLHFSTFHVYGNGNREVFG
ncbi:MAG: NAD(P)-dependent oxidoreductase [Betaproteobacteria bacterium]|nr:NAD(P)-dependent oxidoreductase [Betaproteobacteria bacterium]